MRRYRNRRFARRFYRRRRRFNNYFRQHSEQTRYAKLVATTNTVKRVISLDDAIYVFQGAYSFAETVPVNNIQIHYDDSKDFQNYAGLYTQYRILGVKVTIYKSCVPEVLVSESVDKEFGLLGFNVTLGQPVSDKLDLENSDTMYWLSFLGGWSTQSKFYSLVPRNGGNIATEWQPVTTSDKPIYLSIATRGNADLPNGWKMFYVSVQFMCEFSNPI